MCGESAGHGPTGSPVHPFRRPPMLRGLAMATPRRRAPFSRVLVLLFAAGCGSSSPPATAPASPNSGAPAPPRATPPAKVAPKASAATAPPPKPADAARTLRPRSKSLVCDPNDDPPGLPKGQAHPCIVEYVEWFEDRWPPDCPPPDENPSCDRRDIVGAREGSCAEANLLLEVCFCKYDTRRCPK